VGRGGGVLVGISDSSNIHILKCNKYDGGEILSLDVNVNGFSFAFVVYYHRPCVKNIDDFLAWDKSLLSAKTVVDGDFNLPDIVWRTSSLKNRRNLYMHTSFLDFLDSSDCEVTHSYSRKHVGSHSHKSGDI
jgi:hypothetical protein